MRIKETLLVALSVVLIICLILIGRSCVAERAAVPATPEPTATRKPIPTFAPTPSPSPTPEPTTEPTPQPPFAEEMGFRFEQPQEHTVPAVQIASLKEAEYSPVRAVVSAPQITCSEPDAEGYVTWGISYSTTADVSFSTPSDKSVDAYYVFAGGYDLFDYYSGAMLNSRSDGDVLGERTYTRETLVPAGDESILLSVTEQVVCNWEGWQFTMENGRTAAKNCAVVDAVLTLRAPADYDGLVLGLDVKNAQKVPDDLFSGGTAAKEAPGIWNGYAEDWAFIRANAYFESGDPPVLPALKPEPAPTVTRITPVTPLQSEQTGEKHTYIVNKKTKVFHSPDCGDVKRMNEENKLTVYDTREIVAKKYFSCDHCNP